MKKELFKGSMAMLAKMFSHAEIDNQLLKVYYDVLKRIDDNEWKRMVEKTLREFKPTQNCQFPVPADFLKLYEHVEKDVISKVIAEIESIGSWQSPLFNDPYILSTIESFGGWLKICEWTDEDWTYRRKQFIDTYNGRKATESGRDKQLLGESERSEIEWKNNHPKQLPDPTETKLEDL